MTKNFPYLKPLWTIHQLNLSGHSLFHKKIIHSIRYLRIEIRHWYWNQRLEGKLLWVSRCSSAVRIQNGVAKRNKIGLTDNPLSNKIIYLATTSSYPNESVVAIINWYRYSTFDHNLIYYSNAVSNFVTFSKLVENTQTEFIWGPFLWISHLLRHMIVRPKLPELRSIVPPAPAELLLLLLKAGKAVNTPEECSLGLSVIVGFCCQSIYCWSFVIMSMPWNFTIRFPFYGTFHLYLEYPYDMYMSCR